MPSDPGVRAVSPEAHAVESLARFRALYRRTCSCPDRADLRAESAAVECICAAPLVPVTAERGG